MKIKHLNASLRNVFSTHETMLHGYKQTLNLKHYTDMKIRQRNVPWGPYLQLKWVSLGGQEGACWGGLRMTAGGQPGLKNRASSYWTLKTDRCPPDRVTGLRKRDGEREGLLRDWERVPAPASTLRVKPFPFECNWKRQLMGRGNVETVGAGGPRWATQLAVSPPLLAALQTATNVIKEKVF